MEEKIDQLSDDDIEDLGLSDAELDRIEEIVQSPELLDPLLFFLKEEA